MRQRFMNIPNVVKPTIPGVFPQKGAKLRHSTVGRCNEYFPLRRSKPPNGEAPNDV